MFGLLVLAGIVVVAMAACGAYFWVYDRARARILGPDEIKRRAEAEADRLLTRRDDPWDGWAG